VRLVELAAAVSSLSLDAAQIGAIFTGVAGVIIAIGGVVKVVTTRPRLPVAEELLEQLDELRDDVLALARWAHRAVAQAAAGGVELDPPPEVLKGAGHREGERGSGENTRGWQSSVRAQTGELPIARPETGTQRDYGRRTGHPARRAHPAHTPTMRGCTP
jgi:hypothetical protein